MARTSKSLGTMTLFSVTGAERMPGMTIFSLAFRMLDESDLWFTARMASASSEDVR